MRSKAKVGVGIVIVLAIVAAASYWALARNKDSESTLIKGKIERGSIRITVKATGTLEAVRTVQVGSQISGQISMLYADYNSVVKQGQLLAEIDPRTFQSQVLTAQAGLASAQSRLQSAQADLLNQQANLVQVEANLKVSQVASEQAALAYDRSKQLMAKGLSSASDDDIARTNAQSAAAKVDQSQAAVQSAKAQDSSKEAAIEQAKSDIVAAKADLERAQINLELTKIFSPVDGVVISRNVDIGQTVAASLSAPVLFLIANDLSHMQVNANIDEADIGKVTSDVQVSFSVDAYRSDVFTGKISEVRLAPQTVQNVVTYSVIISVENPQLRLKPGMTANLTMVVDEHDDVLTAPNAALRFTPTDMTPEKIAEILKGAPGASAAEAPTAQEAPALPPVSGGEAGARGASGAAANGQRGQGNRGAGGRGGRGGGGGRAGGSGGSGSGGNGSGRGGNAGGGSGRPQRAVLWVEDKPGPLKPIPVRTGLTDGTRTEIMGANLEAGTEVIVSDLSQTTAAPAARPATNAPFVPNVGGGRGRGGF